MALAAFYWTGSYLLFICLEVLPSYFIFFYFRIIFPSNSCIIYTAWKGCREPRGSGHKAWPIAEHTHSLTPSFPFTLQSIYRSANQPSIIGLGKKPKSTGKTGKLCAHRAEPGIKPPSPDVQGKCSNHLTTVLKLSTVVIYTYTDFQFWFYRYEKTPDIFISLIGDLPQMTDVNTFLESCCWQLQLWESTVRSN